MDKKDEKMNMKDCKNWHGHAGGGAVYGFGLIGALIYFIQNADTFWLGVLGVLKAIIWPAFLVYKLLQFFGL